MTTHYDDDYFSWSKASRLQISKKCTLHGFGSYPYCVDAVDWSIKSKYFFNREFKILKKKFAYECLIQRRLDNVYNVGVSINQWGFNKPNGRLNVYQFQFPTQ